MKDRSGMPDWLQRATVPTLCDVRNVAADAPWNRCKREVEHEPPHRDYFDREWTDSGYPPGDMPDPYAS